MRVSFMKVSSAQVALRKLKMYHQISFCVAAALATASV
ncbi:hypothetical protein BN2497_689 [Janthinobacterium sp. CG23_2]|nr:hypothetical protein BN2497_689 [Janthinobacterium sp. CG23_2]CUU26742.1 hypothetical protein BN3177_689 [Janthinobacterium sp. CG23_2]